MKSLSFWITERAAYDYAAVVLTNSPNAVRKVKGIKCL